MGKKGDKLTSVSNDAAELLLDKLKAIDGITAKKMFGGNGVFQDGKMFGVVNSNGEYYLKVGEGNKADFEKFGSHQHGKMPYFSIPSEIFEDNKKLKKWVKKSIEISK